MYRVLLFVGICALWSTNASASGTSACGTDGTTEMCLTSAALTPASGIRAHVSMTFRITNKTDYPIGLAVLTDTFLFTPEGAVSIGRDFTPEVSGIGSCWRGCNDESNFVVFAPGRPFVVQVRYEANVPPGALPLVRMATTATFSGTMVVLDRGKMRAVPIALPEFRFGNGFAAR